MREREALPILALPLPWQFCKKADAFACGAVALLNIFGDSTALVRALAAVGVTVAGAVTQIVDLPPGLTRAPPVYQWPTMSLWVDTPWFAVPVSDRSQCGKFTDYYPT